MSCTADGCVAWADLFSSAALYLHLETEIPRSPAAPAAVSRRGAGAMTKSNVESLSALLAALQQPAEGGPAAAAEAGEDSEPPSPLL